MKFNKFEDSRNQKIYIYIYIYIKRANKYHLS